MTSIVTHKHIAAHSLHNSNVTITHLFFVFLSLSSCPSVIVSAEYKQKQDSFEAVLLKPLTPAMASKKGRMR